MAKEITIQITGAAGQGIQTIGELLIEVCHNAGLFVFSVDDFESRVRGGHNFHLLRISEQPLSAPCAMPDILVDIDGSHYESYIKTMNPDGIILINNDLNGHDPDNFLNSDRQDKSGEITDGSGENYLSNTFNIPLDQIAKDSGGRIVSNTVAAGLILAILGAQLKHIKKVLEKKFKSKGAKIIDMNLMAVEKGHEIGKNIDFFKTFDFTPVKHNNVVMSGAKAAALGAVAADCRFFSFYPMSPGTGIISNAALYEDQLPIVIEQAEDEIAAVNMAIGASFAGVRSMTSTSGGGFCLMTEGLGLSAMSETPVVILDAQRPGPATGLATRTGQADLLFAVNASQDEFPRFVFAPGSVLDTFNTMKKAFKLSEKYQVPSIVLMDQFLASSARTEKKAFAVGDEHESFLSQDTKAYQKETYLRYKLTDTGISPRKIPCSSPALVKATGNEHIEQGLSSENDANRNAMVEKRFKKLEMMKKEMNQPSMFSPESNFFLTGWGSSKGSIMEACLSLREAGIDAGWIIFEDIWPMDNRKLGLLLQNKKLVMVEGNATCQLGSLIRQATGINYASSVLKYDGRPIYPEYIIEKIKNTMGY